MKVTVEGTTEELLDLAELFTYARTSRHATEAPKNTNTSSRNVRAVQTYDDVPNRIREEGA